MITTNSTLLDSMRFIEATRKMNPDPLVYDGPDVDIDRHLDTVCVSHILTNSEKDYIVVTEVCISDKGTEIDDIKIFPPDKFGITEKTEIEDSIRNAFSQLLKEF